MEFLWSSKVRSYLRALKLLVSPFSDIQTLPLFYSIFYILSICHIPVNVWSLRNEVINTDILFPIQWINRRLIYWCWSTVIGTQNYKSEKADLLALILWWVWLLQGYCTWWEFFLLLRLYLFVYSDTMTILYFLWFTICNYFRNLNNLIPMICQPKPTQMSRMITLCSFSI